MGSLIGEAFNFVGSDGNYYVGDTGWHSDRWGVAGDEVPALVLETEPGDVVVFIHNLKHASFGGGTRRRMFTINCCQHASAETMPFLKECISAHVAYDVDCMYGEKMLTAGPGRRVHLDQVLANQEHMAGEAVQWRAEQAKKGGS